ncbi:hypothetical protein OK006_6874 [Actinobacteria bacterium OK006]|nr:hypothetical protein OK006_6874 [Actinobacteria bacterium OK006]
MGSPFRVSGRVRHRATGILTCMTEWLIFAGCLVIASTAWSLDGTARGTAEDARLKAFVDQDRHSAVVEPDAVERLGPLALGSLSGRDRWGVKQGAVARLVAEGLLHRTSPDEPGQQRWVARGTLPEDADEFERELWAAATPLRVPDPAFSSAHDEGEYLWNLRAPNAHHLLDEAEARLIGEGYARGPFEPVPGGRRLRGRWSTAATAAAVPVVAVLVLDHAWIRAVLALIIGMATLGQAVPGGPVMPRWLPTTTGKGEKVLRMARERFADLDPATRPDTQAYDPRQVRMAVALFGSTVLERIDDKILTDWAPEPVFVEGPGE